MSYDQWIYKDPKNEGPVKDWKKDHMIPIGSMEVVKKLLEFVLPGLRWRSSENEEWSEAFSAGPAFEVSLSKLEGDDIKIIRLRGASMNEAVEVAEKLGLSVFDPQTGEQCLG